MHLTLEDVFSPPDGLKPPTALAAHLIALLKLLTHAPEPLSIEFLAGRLGAAPSSLAVELAALLGLKLLERDRRRGGLSLTPFGRALLEAWVVRERQLALSPEQRPRADARHAA